MNLEEKEEHVVKIGEASAYCIKCKWKTSKKYPYETREEAINHYKKFKKNE